MGHCIQVFTQHQMTQAKGPFNGTHWDLGALCPQSTPFLLLLQESECETLAQSIQQYILCTIETKFHYNKMVLFCCLESRYLAWTIMVSLRKIHFLFPTTNFFNRHTNFGFAFKAHLHRGEKNTVSPESNILLVRAKDNMMVIMILILFTEFRQWAKCCTSTMPLNPEKKKKHILGSPITFFF